jgi:hypothetical protein
MNGQLTAAEPDDIPFEVESSSILAEAIREFEASRQELDVDEACGSEEAWSLLATQVVGRENF